MLQFSRKKVLIALSILALVGGGYVLLEYGSFAKAFTKTAAANMCHAWGGPVNPDVAASLLAAANELEKDDAKVDEAEDEAEDEAKQYMPVVVDEMPPVQPYTLETTAQMEPPKFEVGNAYTNASFADAFAQIVSPNTASAESAPPRQENKPKTVHVAELPPVTVVAPRAVAPKPVHKAETKQPAKQQAALTPTAKAPPGTPKCVDWTCFTSSQRYVFSERYTLQKCPIAAKIPPVSAAERAVLEGKLSGPLVLQIFVTSWIDSHCGELAEIAEQYRHGRHKKS